jgi:hypothetical protein
MKLAVSNPGTNTLLLAELYQNIRYARKHG